ncbi:MAG: TonB-dependent receptor [Bacteroidaceae bacterium]|nr:TonB-dependent receptor [Bacteroidaceae bacterium]
MKRFLGLFLLMLCSLSAMADKFSVSGTVMDGGAQDEPLAGAVVTLLNPTDSAQVTGVLAGADGKFQLPVSKAGSYLLRVSFLGYVPRIQAITLNKKSPTFAAGEITLEPDAKALKETEVTAKLAQVEMKADTFIYNADAYRLPEGATLDALIKKLPGAKLNDDGTISINGKTVSKIMANGKDYFEGDNKMALKSFNVKAVKNIKAYDKKSDYSRITGIDDGEEETVLDLTVKPGMMDAWDLNIDLGYGTEDRYKLWGTASKFTEHSNLTLTASRNNVNDGGWGRWGGGGGITTSDMYGVNFGWENGRQRYTAKYFEIGGNVRYSHTKNESETKSNSEMFLSETTSSFKNAYNNSVSKSGNLNAGLRMEWMPDSFTTLTFRPMYSHSESHNRGNSTNLTFNDDPYKFTTNPMGLFEHYDIAENKMILDSIGVNSNVRETMSDSYSNQGSADFQVNRRLGKAGRNITMNVGGRYSKSDATSWSRNEVKYYQDETHPADFTNQYNLSPSKSYNYQARFSYTEPLTSHLNLQASYQLQHRFSDNNRSMYSIDSLLTKFEGYYTAEQLYLGYLPGLDSLNYCYNRENSQYATYKELNHDAQLLFRYNNKWESGSELNFNAGLSFQPQTTHMDYTKNTLDTTVVRHTFNWAPRVRLRYKISNTSTLDVRYNARMNQPSMTNLLEVVDSSDPLNISTGNAGLRSSWNNNMNLFYNGYNTEKQRGWSLNANYGNTKNSISTATVYNTKTGGSYSRPMNINGNWNAGGMTMFNTAMGPKKAWNFTTMVHARYNHNVGYLNANSDADLTAFMVGNRVNLDRLFATVDLQQAITRTTNLNHDVRINYRNDLGVNGDWSLEVGVNGDWSLQHSRSKVRSTANMDNWNFNYGGNVVFSTPFNLSFSSDIEQQSRRGYSDKTMNTNELVWNARLSQNLKNWLRGQDLTVMVEWNDILNRKSNISRAISSTMRSDTWSNAINSYLMVHVIYRLNLRGNRDQRQGMFGPGGGMRGGFPGGGPGHGGGGGGGMRGMMH